MSTTAAADYPASFTFDPPEKIARWRPLVHWLLAIPHFIIVYVLGVVAQVLAFVAWILGVFTGKVPEGILGVLAMHVRYSTRVGTYVSFLKEEYPPFTFATALADPGDDPRVRVDFLPETEGRNRLTIFFRFLMVIPHIIVLYVISIVAFFVYIIGFFAVLFTGKWPTGLMNFVVGLLRWNTRLSAYMFLLTDKFPPFGFK